MNPAPMAMSPRPEWQVSACEQTDGRWREQANCGTSNRENIIVCRVLSTFGFFSVVAPAVKNDKD